MNLSNKPTKIYLNSYNQLKIKMALYNKIYYYYNNTHITNLTTN